MKIEREFCCTIPSLLYVVIIMLARSVILWRLKISNLELLATYSDLLATSGCSKIALQTVAKYFKNEQNILFLFHSTTMYYVLYRAHKRRRNQALSSAVPNSHCSSLVCLEKLNLHVVSLQMILHYTYRTRYVCYTRMDNGRSKRSKVQNWRMWMGWRWFVAKNSKESVPISNCNWNIHIGSITVNIATVSS